MHCGYIFWEKKSPFPSSTPFPFHPITEKERTRSRREDDQKSSPVNLPSALSNQNGVKRKVRTKKKKGIITANVAGTKYEIVRIVAGEMAFHKTRDEDETANLIWNDSAVQHEKIAELRNYQVQCHSPTSTHQVATPS
ncbi:tubulin polyglutamylase TTLL7 isoform X1 [Tachysurus ichikawai]